MHDPFNIFECSHEQSDYKSRFLIQLKEIDVYVLVKSNNNFIFLIFIFFSCNRQLIIHNLMDLNKFSCSYKNL